MKNVYLTLTALFCITLSVNAQQYKPELTKARKDVKEAQLDLAQAKKDSAAEYQQFRKESLDQVKKNNLAIQQLKTDRINEKKKSDKNYQDKVATLEEKNRGLNNKIKDYKADGNTNWVAFKREFNEQMAEWNKEYTESRD